MKIADDLLLALDAAAFARAAGIEPDPWQADVLRSTSSRIAMNCARQAGKSSVTAVLALHTALYDPGALVLLLSPSMRQSQELFRKCLDTYRAVDRSVPASAESALRLELDNGSRLVSLPGTETSIRGYSAVRLLIVDEASRVDDALYYSVRPMLAVSGGRLIVMSTPWGKRGFFYKEFTEGGPDWERYEVPAARVPRISAAFLAEERRSLGPFFYQQEYECQFSETSDQLFGYDEVMAAVTSGVHPLFGPAAASSERAETEGEVSHERRDA